MGDIGKRKGVWEALYTSKNRIWAVNEPLLKTFAHIISALIQKPSSFKNTARHKCHHNTDKRRVWEGRVDKGRANRHLTYLFVFFVLRLEEEAFMDCSPSTYLERLSQTVNSDSGVGGNAKHRGPEHLLCKHGIRSLLRCGVFSWKLALSDIENLSRDSSVSPNLLPGEVSA